jgi:hypothetical protein
MTKQEQLTKLLDERIIWPRVVSHMGWSVEPLWNETVVINAQSRPTVEQLAQELLGVTEIRALRLGAWLTTPDGAMITEAVEAISPPLYRQDIELVVAALKLAAKMQQEEGQGKAGMVAAGALGVAAVIAIGLAGAGDRAA